jgi:hypothetical protein
MVPDGRLIAGASLDSNVDTWLYEANELPAGTMRVATLGAKLLADQLKVSADALRVIALDDSPALHFIDLP